ncbi:uncharacterized protein RMCC_5629 [Mycolicibacterium canariasense]|uniref:Uncharacterized protein n=1 Tax=Mycolicibacterium canariasense TaxID=228230 RepID=A0A100WIS6_MYCCR|nr:uncharacterized protein RMCC_5629 [Mycolicibacterium canariasense]
MTVSCAELILEIQHQTDDGPGNLVQWLHDQGLPHADAGGVVDRMRGDTREFASSANVAAQRLYAPFFVKATTAPPSPGLVPARRWPRTSRRHRGAHCAD